MNQNTNDVEVLIAAYQKEHKVSRMRAILAIIALLAEYTALLAATADRKK
jgi:hypothetical protein